MKYTTDIDQLMEEVKATLDMSLPTMPMYKHPLYTGFALPDNLPPMGPFKNMGMMGVLTHKVAAFNQAVDDKDWSQCVWLTERPFRTEFLYNLLSQFEPVPAYMRAKLTKEIWIDSEGPHVNISTWRRWFYWLHEFYVDSGEGDDPCPEVYTIDELKVRRGLIADSKAGSIRVYRGTCSKEADASQRGLSWTLSKQKAEWFAKRFARAGSKGAPLLFTGEVSVEHTIGPWLGRSEEEMILPFGCTVVNASPL